MNLRGEEQSNLGAFAMGYNLCLAGSPDGTHVTDLCTTLGYSTLCEWMESLPEAEYPSVRAFARDGHFRPTDRLAIELNGAYHRTPPADREVAHTADRLCDLLGAGRPDETAAVVD